MTSWPGRNRARAAEPVLLNVYDLNTINETTHDWGFGVYHSGIQIHGVEYAYGSAPAAGGSPGGIYAQPPRMVPNARFRESINLGDVRLSSRAVHDLVTAMKGEAEWSGPAYNVVLNNCNRFSEVFARRLGAPRDVPEWVNRLASLGACLSCLLPKELLNRDPATARGGGGGRGAAAGRPAAFAGEGRALLDRSAGAGGAGGAGGNSNSNSNSSPYTQLTAEQLRRTDWKCEKCMRFQGTFDAVSAHELTCRGSDTAR